VNSAYQITRDAQLIYLERLLKDFEKHLGESHEEAWWQNYFGKNILFFQNSHITRLEKLNVAVAGTQFPDFIVATSDSYLDIIEIKKPSTDLLREDTSRSQFLLEHRNREGNRAGRELHRQVTKHSDRYATDARRPTSSI